MLASDIRSADYRGKARHALAMAADSDLLQVKGRHEAAAAVWLGLAAFEDRRSAHARETAALQSVEPPSCNS